MKFNYNYLLMRYKKGCCYIEKNMGEFDESDDEILNGFKLKGENNHGIG